MLTLSKRKIEIFSFFSRKIKHNMVFKFKATILCVTLQFIALRCGEKPKVGIRIPAYVQYLRILEYSKRSEGCIDYIIGTFFSFLFFWKTFRAIELLRYLHRNSPMRLTFCLGTFLVTIRKFSKCFKQFETLVHR